MAHVVRDRPPEAVKLRDQVAEFIKAGMASGKWVETLPSERNLMKELDVSRVTVRAALSQLETGGLIIRKRSKRIIPSTLVDTKSAENPVFDEVIIVSPIDLIKALRAQVVLIDMLREKLVRHGARLRTVVSSRFAQKNCEKSFIQLLKEHPRAVFILVQLPQENQAWFARANVRTIILGSTHPSFPLPAIDIDYEAACYHAATLLASRGRRRIAFIRYAANLSGDKRSESGFLRGCQKFDCVPVVQKVRDNPLEVYDWLKACHKNGRLPDAIIASGAAIYLSAYSYCYSAGLNIPGQIAMICRRDDPLLDALRPSVARYKLNHDKYLSQIWRVLLPVLRNRTYKQKMHLIFPDYIQGESSGKSTLAGPF